ncbi:MAG: 6-phosphogluconate dehydrogenase, partial [Candidatus Omnitrophica bacterium]|nr:6-phosphogluconate dehydrogenase [Candidatus Omnitrophota bacterium]
MMSVKLEFGVIGLGRMGGNLARQALEKGMKVVGFDKGQIAEDLVKLGLVPIKAQED